MSIAVPINTLEQTYACANRFAGVVLGLRRVYLRGEIGAGKTTFVAAVLRALGHAGVVRSPTFTFVEPYVVATADIYHLDLYRLERPADVEFLGIADYLEEGIAFVEWPERASGRIPDPDIDLRIQSVDDVRTLVLAGISVQGQTALTAFERHLSDLRE